MRIQAGPLARGWLARITTIYAYTAFPDGGSECAQASRESLLTLATHLLEQDQPELSTRVRPQLKSAVKWFAAEVGPTQLEAPLLLALKGESVAEQDLPLLPEDH